MQINLNEGGKLRYRERSAPWGFDGPDLLETLVAGEKMYLTTQDGNIKLHYMGFTASGFQTPAQAQEAASGFAQEVFRRLSQMAADFPPGKPARA